MPSDDVLLAAHRAAKLALAAVEAASLGVSPVTLDAVLRDLHYKGVTVEQIEDAIKNLESVNGSLCTLKANLP